MAIYHLYYLSGGALIGADDIEAGDDREAADIAVATGRGDIVEIWNASTRVRIVRPSGGKAAGPAPAEALRPA